MDTTDTEYQKNGENLVVELTGIPGSGKTTLKNLCASELKSRLGEHTPIQTEPIETWKGIAKKNSQWLWNQDFFKSKLHPFKELKDIAIERAKQDFVEIQPYLAKRLGVKRAHRTIHFKKNKRRKGILLTDAGIITGLNLFMFGELKIEQRMNQIKPYICDGYPDLIIWLKCSKETAVRRIKTRIKPNSHIGKLLESSIAELLPYYEESISMIVSSLRKHRGTKVFEVDNE